MPWSPEPGAGFTAADAEPWLPVGARVGLTVAEQRGDPSSALTLTRDLVALRRRSADLRAGAYERLPASGGVWAWRRGGRTVVALNFSGEEAVVDDAAGTVALATDRERDGEPVEGRLALAPWQGAVVIP
jgi:hypothetical protein